MSQLCIEAMTGGIKTFQSKYDILNQNSKKVREIMEVLYQSYLHAKLVLKEDEVFFIRSEGMVYRANFIVTHIENVIAILNEKERFIIFNEFILGKRGKWFTEYFALSTYYRLRTTAYKTFLLELER